MGKNSYTYRIYYGILDGNEIADIALVKNINYGERIGDHGSRSIIPDITSQRKLEERYGFYSKLKSSIEKEGIRNPIFCQSIEEGTFAKYGLSRLWIAKQIDIKIPCIIADYVDRWTNLEELFSIEDIKAKYTDIPYDIELNENFIRIAGCEQMHLDMEHRDFFEKHHKGAAQK